MYRHTKPAYSVREVEEMAGVSHVTVQKAINSGALPSVKIGRRRIVPDWGVDQWLGRKASEGQ